MNRNYHKGKITNQTIRKTKTKNKNDKGKCDTKNTKTNNYKVEIKKVLYE